MVTTAAVVKQQLPTRRAAPSEVTLEFLPESSREHGFMVYRSIKAVLSKVKQ
jgi:hypothetical protein